MEAKKQSEVLSVTAHEEMIKKERRANNVWNKLKRNKTAMIGLVIVVFMIFIAIFAPLLTQNDPDEISPLNAFLLPGEDGHIFGTDEFGRDLFARILYGARVSMVVAVGGTIDRWIYGRNRRFYYHAYYGWTISLSFCIVIHYFNDRLRFWYYQCYYRHWNWKYSKFCSCCSWGSTYCEK